ncbi:MAG TPA: DeoR/GlpR family DNA-binding transcription regulator [Stackebrandtia sp.]|uniref:DeoR/GlpR family DNA-binding transcription regulator n=1 Tax=Stackebrandtia sp. TaxID=2023065 RepID=UPI002D72F341|nr:DeoR/GlpR family DNA-binding transcription regulator [Stackebrandtia sp.]HZE41910.1 DeoR/GlpR family DNA-binding transcription regulator [Stackebrandtia sp.]
MNDTQYDKAKSPQQRQKLIAEVVVERRSLSAQELATMFDVSVMTVHRDLDELERQGVVRKYRGGVTAQPSGVFESNVSYRQKSMLNQKRAIAKHASRYVEPGMSIMLDDATTTAEMIPLLAELSPLRVATNYLEGMRQLSQLDGVGLMALGGDYDPLHDSFMGGTCLECIESLRVDAVFVSTSALSGLYAFHQEDRIVAVKRKMLEVAEKRYLLMDNSKLGKVALYRLVPLSDFDMIIVDSGTDSAALAELKRNNITCEVAE